MQQTWKLKTVRTRKCVFILSWWQKLNSLLSDVSFCNMQYLSVMTFTVTNWFAADTVLLFQAVVIVGMSFIFSYLLFIFFICIWFAHLLTTSCVGRDFAPLSSWLRTSNEVRWSRASCPPDFVDCVYFRFCASCIGAYYGFFFVCCMQNETQFWGCTWFH